MTLATVSAVDLFLGEVRRTALDALEQTASHVTSLDWVDWTGKGSPAAIGKLSSYSAAPLDRLTTRCQMNVMRFQRHYVVLFVGMFLLALVATPVLPLLMLLLAVVWRTAQRLGAPLVPPQALQALKILTVATGYLTLLIPGPSAFIVSLSVAGSVVVLHVAFRDTDTSMKKVDHTSGGDDDDDDDDDDEADDDGHRKMGGETQDNIGGSKRGETGILRARGAPSLSPSSPMDDVEDVDQTENVVADIADDIAAGGDDGGGDGGDDGSRDPEKTMK